MKDEDGYDHVPFVQGMTLPPRTIAHATIVIPNGFFDHPIAKWQKEHGRSPSRWETRRIMRTARKQGWDSKPYDDAVREMQHPLTL